LNNFKRIFLITVDCLRADHVGCIGGVNLTPNIDRLARESVVFTKAFANGPGTNQSFPAILTSTYFLMHGGMHLLPHYTTLAEVLSRHGFKTAAFHSNPFLSKGLGWGRGFHEFYDFIDVLKSPSATVARSRLSSKAIRFLNRMTKILKNEQMQSLLRRFYYRWNKFEVPYIEGALLNRYVTSWIRKNKKEKFFLWVHFMDPHRPYIPPRPYLNLFGTREEAFIFDTLIDPKIKQGISMDDLRKLKRLYEGEVRYVDCCIGNLIEFLQDQDLMDDSILILSADHGEAFNEHGKLTHAYDVVYNEVIHVPLLIYGLADRAMVLDEYVQLLDIPSTIVDVLGIKQPYTFLGDSLISLLEGKEQHRPIFSESAKPDLINLRYDTSKRVVSCIMKDWKLIVNELWKTIELYNIAKDFKEKENLIESESEVRERLSVIIEEHLIFEKSFKLRLKSKVTDRKRIKELLKTLRLV